MDRVKISYFMDALCVWAYVSQVRIDEMKASFVEAVELALLWQIDLLWLFTDLSFAVRACLRWRSKNEIDDCLAYRRQAWLRRRSVDSFFSAPPVRGDGVARRRRRSWSSARDDEDLARIVPQSDQARVPLSIAGGLVHKSIVL